MSTCPKEGCCKKCPISIYKEKKAAIDPEQLKGTMATVAAKLEPSKDFIKFWLSAVTLNYVPYTCFIVAGIVAIIIAFKLPNNILFNLCFTAAIVYITVFAQKKFLLTAMQKFAEKQEYDELYNKFVEHLAAIKIMFPCKCQCCCDCADMKSTLIRFGVMCGFCIFFYFIPLRWIMLFAFIAAAVSIAVCFLRKNEKFMQLFNKYMGQLKEKCAEMKKNTAAPKEEKPEEPKAEQPAEVEPPKSEPAEQPAED